MISSALYCLWFLGNQFKLLMAYQSRTQDLGYLSGMSIFLVLLIGITLFIMLKNFKKIDFIEKN